MDRVLLLVPTTTYRVNAFMAAAERLNIDVVVGSDHHQTLSALVPDTTIALNFRKPETAVDKIVDFVRKKPFQAIIGVDEETVILAAMASQALSFSHNPITAVKAARDKYRMRQKMLQGGLLSPKMSLFSIDKNPHKISERIQYPCVLKPTFLSASRGVVRADNPEQFSHAFRQIRELLSDSIVANKGGEAARQVLVEDYIPGGEVALEGMLINGKLKVLALFDKPDPLEGPYFVETIYVTPSRLPENLRKEIIETTFHAAEALGLHRGPIHAELRFNESGVWPIEIAARSIGGLCSRVLQFDGDVSLEELIIRNALGIDVRGIRRETQAAGVMMVPIPRRGILQKVENVEAAKQVPGVEDVVISIPRFQEVEPMPWGARYLGFIFARGETPDGVEQAIREAYQKMEIVMIG